jgi:hypothetical protein
VRVLSLLAAFQAVKADFSHPLHFKKVDAAAAKSIAAAKGSKLAAASGNLVNDQVIERRLSMVLEKMLTCVGLLVLQLHHWRQPQPRDPDRYRLL